MNSSSGSEDLTRVIFVHGLESGPHGTKVQKMREAGFEVRSIDMEMSVFRLNKKNSVLRNILRTRGFWYWVLLSIAILGVGFFRDLAWKHIIFLFLGGNAFLFIMAKSLIAEAWTKSIESSIDLQLELLANFKPDVVVGSSYGGAVSLELVRRRLWTGPTILLAPAYNKILARVRIEEHQEHLQKIRELSKEQKIVVFHDPSDDVIPHKDSVELCENSKIEIHSPNAGGHRLLGILDDGQLFEEIRKITAPTA